MQLEVGVAVQQRCFQRESNSRGPSDPGLADRRADDRSKRRLTHMARRGRSMGATVRSCRAAPMQSQEQACARPTRDARNATRSPVSSRAADGCIARMMRKPNGARLLSDPRLLLLQGVGLLGLPRAEQSVVAQRRLLPEVELDEQQYSLAETGAPARPPRIRHSVRRHGSGPQSGDQRAQASSANRLCARERRGREMGSSERWLCSAMEARLSLNT
jgi:hypothetical protein